MCLRFWSLEALFKFLCRFTGSSKHRSMQPFLCAVFIPNPTFHYLFGFHSEWLRRSLLLLLVNRLLVVCINSFLFWYKRPPSGGGGLNKTPGGGTGGRRRRWRRAWQWTASIWAMGLVGVLRKNSVYCGLFSTVWFYILHVFLIWIKMGDFLIGGEPDPSQ